jgi:trimethylamine--corrinoid protein Co-methyltransferase
MASAVVSDMLLGAGLLNGSTIWSYEQMIMDCEIFGIIARMMEGIVVDDEQIALDAIREVGPGGSYMMHEHTLRHMRELWISSLMDRRPYSEWEKKRGGARTWALARARNILEAHDPAPLDPKVEAELQRIIQAIENK